jgi:hypothetical protein
MGPGERLREPPGWVGQGAAVAPDLVHRRVRLLGFDDQGWIQLLGGLVIALYSSYDHINIGSIKTGLNGQWGVVFIVASLAVVAVAAAGFCEAVAQLATRSLRREEDRRIEVARTAAEERDRAARR